MTGSAKVKLPQEGSEEAGSNQIGTNKGQRTALTVEALAQSFLDNLFFVQGR